MTDEELITRLREGFPWMKEAADRIEALVKELDATSIERDFFQSEVKLRNRIPATSDPVADLQRRAERLEAALKMARAYVENMARTWEHAQQDLAHIDTALKGADHE